LSKPRYDWWPYVKGVIRRYPLLKEEFADLHTQSITANYSLAPGGSGASRTTELIAIKRLPTTKLREYAAVYRAIETTERYKDGQDRLKIIRLVFWDKTHTVDGAGLTVPVSAATAWRWNGEFIRLVASYYGLMDER
jgi:hypothetical protein